jgi:LCP family protein required for cell wall assembly
MAEPQDERPMPEEAPPPKPPRSGHPRARKVFLVLAGVLSLLIAGGSAFSVQTIHTINRSIGHIPVKEPGKPCNLLYCLPIDANTAACLKKVCNYLVLGSDSRAGLSSGQQSEFGHSSPGEASRSDTIMFAHLNIPENKTTIVSIPRDLYVDIPGHGFDKINAAYSYGPGVLVKTVEQLTGMPINHYVAVDFAGFESLVAAIGGVPVCIDKPMIDHLAGLDLPHAGCYNLKDQQALGFVRARHIQGDLIPDFSRIARQQVFFRAMLAKLTTSASVIHLPSLLKAIRHNVVIDQRLNVYDLQDLMNRITVVGQSGVDFRAVPATPFVQNGIDYVRALQPETSEIFSRIKHDQKLFQLGKELPLTGMSPANVRVQVLDMNSGGRAEKVAEYLSRAGFYLLKIRPAPANLIHNQVRWAPDMHLQRKALMQYMHGVRAVQGQTFGPGGAIVVVVGPDFPQQQ